LDIGIGFYPHRPARRGQTIFIDPYDLLVRSFFSGPGYFNHADKSGVLGIDLVGYVVYNNGPLQAGILAAGSRYHIGPEAFLASRVLRRSWLGSEFFHVLAKCSNGRFFFNAEAAWLYWTDRLSGLGAARS
jgi:hypothetical protein